MILEKKKLQAIVKVTLVVFLTCTILSYAGAIPASAGISDSKYNLIQVLSPLLKDDSAATKADREAVLVLMGVDLSAETYAIDENIDDNLDDIISILDEYNNAASPSVDPATLESCLEDFYTFQQGHQSIASITLLEFRNGLIITTEYPSTYPNFITIKTNIETYTYDYLLLINFIQKAKVLNGLSNVLYEDEDGDVNVSQKFIEDIDDIAPLIPNIGTYKTRMTELIGKLNGSQYDSERPYFIANLAKYNLIDRYNAPDDDDDNGPSGGTSGGTATPSAPTPQANSDGSSSIKIAATLNSTTGNAASAVSENVINQLLTLSKPQTDGTKDIVIDVPKVDGAKSYTMSIPGNALSKSTASEEITIKTDAGNITLPSNIFAGDDTVKNKNVSLNIAKVDKSTLSPELQQKVGDKPIIELSFTVNGVVKEYSNPDKPATVSFKYTPTGAEALDSEFLVVWYMDNAGNLIEVPNGKYDPATGLVSFTTTHFSKYILVFNQKTFTDVTKTHWAKKEIEVMASKGIARGTTDKTFAPDESITRGDYMAILVRALGVNAVITENFSDIKATDINFKEIAIARKLGITNGVGNNMFKPDEYITRQDLMVLTERALSAVKKIKNKGTAADLDKFSDKSKVASYARDSVATMLKEGILIGAGAELGPVEKTTRAQAATIVYRIYNK
ncbi:MAG TPA: S-layer homology domain-containing protein [Clostridia bacterium]|nr:S-layer homology domain-containing protein [Clostridia bacterium]